MNYLHNLLNSSISVLVLIVAFFFYEVFFPTAQVPLYVYDNWVKTGAIITLYTLDFIRWGWSLGSNIPTTRRWKCPVKKIKGRGDILAGNQEQPNIREK